MAWPPAAEKGEEKMGASVQGLRLWGGVRGREYKVYVICGGDVGRNNGDSLTHSAFSTSKSCRAYGFMWSNRMVRRDPVASSQESTLSQGHGA